MKKFKLQFGLLLLAILGVSCSTEFDVNAPWKETTVVYGLLNANDSVHYIRVNKAFQNLNNDALAIASQIPDSSNYAEGKIKVELIKRSRGEESLAGTLERHITSNKDSGAFSFPEQVIYKTQSLYLDSAASYIVKVTNLETGNVVSSITPLVSNFEITAPRPPGIFGNSISVDRRATVKFTEPKNGAIYQINAAIYIEKEVNQEIIEEVKIEWKVPVQGPISGVLEGVIPENFIKDLLLSNIDASKDPVNTVRYIKQLEFTVYAGSEDFSRYIEINNQFSAITQTKPSFSNIDNGLGLFASRNQKSVIAQADGTSIDRLSKLVPTLKLKRKI